MPQLSGDERTHLLNGGASDGILSTERSRPSVIKIVKDVLLSSVVNVFLVFVPIGIVAGALGWNATAVFSLNFCAIIPLAALLSLATEDLAARVGQTLGGLMNATFGNAVELIVSVIALKNGEIQIVQSSMLGSILSNTLLVLGCCFLIGGLRYPTQSFNQTVAQTMSSLLGVATSSLLIPAAFHSTVPNSKHNDSLVLDLSRGTAIIILVLYVLYLIFSLKTHHAIFDAVSEEEEQVGPEVEITVVGSFILLFIVTILIAICADYMVGSIDALVLSSGLSKTFIGLILIPIVGNAAEHVTAVMVAWKNKMDLAAGVAIGSSIQIALFLTPFLVIVGWIMGQPMTLFFSTFETVIMFISVFMVGYVVQDGESNWLEGSMLLGVYLIICIAFFYFPADEVMANPPLIPSI